MWLTVSVPWIAYHAVRLQESQRCYAASRKQLADAPKEALEAHMWDSLVLEHRFNPDTATRVVSLKYGPPTLVEDSVYYLIRNLRARMQRCGDQAESASANGAGLPLVLGTLLVVGGWILAGFRKKPTNP